jgi:hypothetical protein
MQHVSGLPANGFDQRMIVAHGSHRDTDAMPSPSAVPVIRPCDIGKADGVAQADQSDELEG